LEVTSEACALLPGNHLDAAKDIDDPDKAIASLI
jgi:hypothetical protein